MCVTYLCIHIYTHTHTYMYIGKDECVVAVAVLHPSVLQCVDKEIDNYLFAHRITDLD